MMFEYGRYWGRLINKCIIMSQRGQQYDAYYQKVQAGNSGDKINGNLFVFL